MRGVILAGGTGSRLYPLTKIINKHLLPVGRYPMLYYPLERLRLAGIGRVLIVTNTLGARQMIELLGSGRDFGLDLTYKIQDWAGGIAAALESAEDFAAGESLTVILGDNIFRDELAPFVKAFMNQRVGAKVFLKEVANPSGYGIAETRDGKIIGIEEKPEHPRSNLCVTGVYMYDPKVFQIIRSLRPSARGELEITDVNRAYLTDGELTHEILRDWWVDAGTFETLALAQKLARRTELVF